MQMGKFSLAVAAGGRSVRCDLGHNCTQLNLGAFTQTEVMVWEDFKLEYTEI